MEKAKELLNARKNQLQQMKQAKEKSLITAPEGSLRLSKYKNKVYYYQKMNSKETTGTYIPERAHSLAQQLAQKDYDKKVLETIEKEQKVVERFLKDYPEITMEKIYEGLHEERQKLVEPVQMTEEQFVKRWEEKNYQGQCFKEGIPELYTARGERVRSKSEVIIADTLQREGIPYRYEYPVFLKGWGEVYPDFMVLNVRERKEIYWEHLGRMDDPDYVEKVMHKVEQYAQNGIFPGEKLILTYESKKSPLNQKIVKLMIQHYLK